MSGIAHADVTFNGFGQVVGGAFLDEEKVFPVGPGYDGDPSFDSETLAALQATADVSERITATVQIIGRGREEYDAKLAWGFLSADLGSGWSVKVGRLRTPLYRYSDFLEVGTAYSWLRPPISVYDNTVNETDGLLLSRAGYAGNWYLTGQLIYGSSNSEAQGNNVKTRNQVGGAFEALYNDWLLFRLGAFSSSLTISNDSLDAITDALIATGETDAATEFAVEDDRITYASAAIEIDLANWLLGAEYTRNFTDEVFIPEADRYYVSLGHRIGKFTPTIVYGERSADANEEIVGMVDPTNPAYGGVLAVVNAQEYADTYVSVGLRYDVTPSVALKFDYTHYTSDYSDLHEALFGETKDADLISAGVAFTF